MLQEKESDQIELSETESDQDAAELLAQINTLQAQFNNRYLQIVEEQASDGYLKINQGLEERIKQLEGYEKDHLQIIENLVEEIEQLKRELQNILPKKPIYDVTSLAETQMGTTEGTHQTTEESISTFMLDIAKIASSLGRRE